MDTSERTRLRALCEAATPGPWHTEAGGVVVRADGRQVAAVTPCGGSESLTERDARAELFAAARTALPAALDALDAVERELAADEAALTAAQQEHAERAAWCAQERGRL